jgi:DNA polymerase III sliding clamp (beta) subunit (PCNA family)
MLNGILIDVTSGSTEFRLVATDRYRLAIAAATMSDASCLSTRAIAPSTFVDEVLDALGGRTDDIAIDIDEVQISVTVGTSTITGQRLNYDFPDYYRLLDTRWAHRIDVAAGDIRDLVVDDNVVGQGEDSGLVSPTCVLAFEESASGRLEFDLSGEDLRIGVNREFLLEAVNAVGEGQLVLELDGPIAPLAIRNLSYPGRFSILMPIQDHPTTLPRLVCPLRNRAG